MPATTGRKSNKVVARLLNQALCVLTLSLQSENDVVFVLSLIADLMHERMNSDECLCFFVDTLTIFLLGCQPDV